VGENKMLIDITVLAGITNWRFSFCQKEINSHNAISFLLIILWAILFLLETVLVHGEEEAKILTDQIEHKALLNSEKNIKNK